MTEPTEVTLRRRLADAEAARDSLVARVSYRDDEIATLTKRNGELEGSLESERARCMQVTQDRDSLRIQLASIPALSDNNDLRRQLEITSAARAEQANNIASLQKQLDAEIAYREEAARCHRSLEDKHAKLVEERDRIANQRNKFNEFLKAIADRLELGMGPTLDRMLEVIDGLKRRAITTVDADVLRNQLHKHLGDCYKPSDMKTTEGITRAIDEMARKARVSVEDRNVLFNTLEKFTEQAGIRAQGALAYDGTGDWARRVWERAVKAAGEQYTAEVHKWRDKVVPLSDANDKLRNECHNWEATVRDRDREITELRKCNDKQAEQLRDCMPAIKENYKKLLAKLLSLKLVTKDYCVNDNSTIVINDLTTELFKLRGEPLAIDWSAIATRYKWVAKDGDGRWFAYECKPEIGCYTWLSRDSNPLQVNENVTGTAYWENSLQERQVAAAPIERAAASPVVEWEKLNICFQWVAGDANGHWFAYTCRPEWNTTHREWRTNGGTAVPINIKAGTGSPYPATTLMQRPPAAAPVLVVDWSKVRMGHDWVAMDRGGNWYAYQDKPRADRDAWVGAAPWVVNNAIKGKPSCAWFDTLHKRPETKAPKRMGPVINWDTVPKQYNWVAMDGDDGQWFAYDLKPVYCDRTECWEEPDHGSSMKLGGILRWSASAASSLMERPAATATPPGVCWSDIPSEFKWAAMDADCTWHVYVERPTFAGGLWVPFQCSASRLVRCNFDSSVSAEGSLVRRPAADVKPPDVCWSGIPRELEWAAMDADGQWYAYASRPTYVNGSWIGHGSFTRLLKAGNTNTSTLAADSLVRRPC